MSNSIFHVYLITNSVNDKCYVGQTTKSLDQRWKSHLRETRDGSNFRLHNAIRKYGAHNFVMEILTTTTAREQLDQLERLWIIALHSHDRSIGYNMTMGGDGVKGNAEMRERSRVNNTGEKNPMFGRVHPLKGKKRGPLSPESKTSFAAKVKGRKTMLGKVFSEESRRKMSLAAIVRAATPEGKQNCSKGGKKGAAVKWGKV